MSTHALSDYTFEGLLRPLGKPAVDPGPCESLCYLVGLAESPHHKIAEPLPAKRILSWLYDFEEQATDAAHLKAGEEYFDRYFDGGYLAKTPCMISKQWSPISALLEKGNEPLSLQREERLRAVATGTWDPRTFAESAAIDSATTDEALFWAVIAAVSRLGVAQQRWVSVIAKPGWNYDVAIGSLRRWPPEEVAKAGRVLWKRTPRG